MYIENKHEFDGRFLCRILLANIIFGMKRINPILFLLCFLVLTAQAQTVRIYRGGFPVGVPYSSLSMALSLALHNDSLVLSAHKFNEHDLNIIKNVVLQGTISGGDTTTIDAQGLGRVLSIDNNLKVRIWDMILTNGAITGQQGAGVNIAADDTVVIGGNSVIRNNYVNAWRGAGIYVGPSKLTITGNTRIYNNMIDGTFSIGTSGIIGGAAINSSNAELVIEEHVSITDNEYKASSVWGNLFIGGGAIASSGKVTITGSVRISNNKALHGGAIFMYGTPTSEQVLTIDGKDIIIDNNTATSDTGAAIYLRQNPGMDTTGPELHVRNAQIIGNHAATAPAIYCETQLATISNCRLFNPQPGGAHTNEVLAGQKSFISSDSTWWGESDTTGIILYDGILTTLQLHSWAKAFWTVNGGLPITGLSTFPVTGAFRLNSSSPLAPASFPMLQGDFSASAGSFLPATSMMTAANEISSDYTSPSITSGTNIRVIVDADTFNYTATVTGTSVDELTTKHRFSIAPNPATAQLHIYAVSNATVCITNIMGSKIMESPVVPGDNILDIGGLTPGTYLLQWMDEDGKSQVSRFVKE